MAERPIDPTLSLDQAGAPTPAPAPAPAPDPEPPEPSPPGADAPATPDSKTRSARPPTKPKPDPAAAAPSPVPPTTSSRGRVPIVPLATVDAQSYEFAAEFGRGGLGRVIRATDRRLGRPVAIKELLAPSLDMERRFVREAMITARLQHPGIVPVYEAGRWPSGEPFYAMRIIAGRSLGEALRNTRTLDQRLALLPSLIAATKAVAYAHSEGVIHRDLKPANIMLGPFGETVVIDWGLAKTVDGPQFETLTPTPSPVPRRKVVQGPTSPGGAGRASPDDSAEPEPTRLGSVLGTPHYMAPEQARGEQADRRSDVYALGTILYALLAGKPPFDDLDGDTVIVAVATRAPTPLEDFDSEAPRELEAICAKAMAREARERYPDAGELAADLERFTTGQLVGAHRYRAWQLVARFVRRHLAAVVASAVLLAVLAGVAIISVRQIIAERERAERARLSEAMQRERAENRSAELTLTQARAALRTDPTATLAWLRQYPDSGPAWGAVRQLIAAADEAGVARHVLSHARSLCCLVMLPSGRAAVGDGSGTVTIWDLASARREVLAQGDPVHELVNAGGTLAWSTDEGSVHIRRAGIPGVHQLRPPGDSVSSLTIAPGGDRLLWRTRQGVVELWEPAGVRELSKDRRFTQFAFTPTALLMRGSGGNAAIDLGGGVPMLPDDRDTELAVAPNGKRWALALFDGRIIVGDTDPRAMPTIELIGHKTKVFRLLFSPPGDRLLSIDSDDKLVLWDIKTGGFTELGSTPNAIMAAALSPGARRAATAEFGTGVITLWDLQNPLTRTRKLLGHVGAIKGLTFSDDDTLLSAGEDQALRVWPLGGRGAAARLSLQSGSVIGLAAPEDGRWLAVAHMASPIELIDGKTGASRLLEPPPGRRIDALVADPRGQWFAALDRNVVLYDPGAGAGRELPADDVNDLASSPDGRTLAGAGKRLHLWDVATGVDRAPDTPAPTPQVAVTFSRDGAWLATADDSGVVTLWPSATGGPPRTLGSHGVRLRLLEFTPRGELVSLATNGELRMWDLATGAGRVLGRAESAKYAALSPDGNSLAVSGESNQIALFALPSGQSRVFAGHTGEVYALAFSPDSRRLASGADMAERALRLWDVRSGEGRAMRGPDSMVTRILFASDGRSVVFGDGGGGLWRGRDDLPEEIAALSAHVSTLTSARIGSGDLPWTP